MKEKSRCTWCGADPVYVKYHDTEWGVPVYNDQKLFEFLVLEGAQAGLSWITILRRREGYRKAFSNFDPQKVAKYDAKKIAKLLKDPDIIRNKLKIQSAVKNAKAFLKIQKEFGSFSHYQWQFVNNKAVQNKFTRKLPAKTKQAEVFSKDLKKRSFSFVGPTIIYAHMQAVGMVNDHVVNCFRHKEVAAMSKPIF